MAKLFILHPVYVLLTQKRTTVIPPLDPKHEINLVNSCSFGIDHLNLLNTDTCMKSLLTIEEIIKLYDFAIYTKEWPPCYTFLASTNLLSQLKELLMVNRLNTKLFNFVYLKYCKSYRTRYVVSEQWYLSDLTHSSTYGTQDQGMWLDLPNNFKIFCRHHKELYMNYNPTWYYTKSWLIFFVKGF